MLSRIDLRPSEADFDIAFVDEEAREKRGSMYCRIVVSNELRNFFEARVRILIDSLTMVDRMSLSSVNRRVFMFL